MHPHPVLVELASNRRHRLIREAEARRLKAEARRIRRIRGRG